MSTEKKSTLGVEWRITVGDDCSRILIPEAAGGPASRVWQGLKAFVAGFVSQVWRFLKKAWDLGVEDPRKVIHCLKVGMALAAVSLFYYMRPLYDGVGGNAMWAVMTVVVAFENSAGATISKSINRVVGSTVAGFLALGVHWLASQAGERYEPFIVGVSVFILASAATFSRFIPTIKERFDYGAMIFILTFSLVAVSGYRVEELFKMAHQRISTVIIGTSLCIIISMLICPIWAGQNLHTQTFSNMDKLANSLEGCVIAYFDINAQFSDSEEQSDKRLLGYKCVLGSKASEESMSRLAKWEPAHGRFNFNHPWSQYLEIGAAMRSCAYCIDALKSCIDSENQTPEFMKNHLSNNCLRLSSCASSVLRELAITIKTMTKSSGMELLIEEMNSIVQDVQNSMNCLSHDVNINLVHVIPVVTVATILIEIAVRTEATVEAVEVLANLAGFNIRSVHDQDKSKQNLSSDGKCLPGLVKEEDVNKNVQTV